MLSKRNEKKFSFLTRNDCFVDDIRGNLYIKSDEFFTRMNFFTNKTIRVDSKDNRIFVRVIINS